MEKKKNGKIAIADGFRHYATWITNKECVYKKKILKN